MIVWVNGAFGAGKTTLAAALRDRLPDALTFDPEYVGLLLRQSVPGPVADFQDLPLWRRLTAEFVTGLCLEYGRPLIVPMTLVNRAYRDEIFGAIGAAGVDLLHVFIEVPADELRRRIDGQVLMPGDPDGDARAREFRTGTIARCVAARSELPPEAMVLRGDLLSPEQLADQVVRSGLSTGLRFDRIAYHRQKRSGDP